MSYALAKSLVGLAILITGLSAVLTMWAVLGRPPSPTPPLKLKRLHRIFGWGFGVFLLFNALVGYLRFLDWAPGLSFRGYLHVYLGLALAVIFLIKIGVVKIFRQHLKMAVGLGLTLGVLTVVIALTMAVPYLLGPRPASASVSQVALSAGDPEAGRIVFQNLCADCHAPDSLDPKAGPGLKNLFGKPLPDSGLPPTEEAVRTQIHSPRKNMPAFPSLQGRELDHLIAYLRTL
jgi:mono/diheme cytochrome c family protein